MKRGMCDGLTMHRQVPLVALAFIGQNLASAHADGVPVSGTLTADCPATGGESARVGRWSRRSPPLPHGRRDPSIYKTKTSCSWISTAARPKHWRWS